MPKHGTRTVARWIVVAGMVAGLAAPARAADPAPFDLAGATLRVRVTRAGTTLPIAQVPNLAPGDRLTIAPDLPGEQSVRYLLVTAFLRGATNPPPKTWFARAETWTRKGRGGLTITVPEGAKQLVVFMAPDTGGGFDTIVGAVRGRPGAFVRASQDLNQASLDRSRLDAYLAGVARVDPLQPDRLEAVTPVLARSLSVTLKTECLQRMPDLQAACLTQGREALLLSDGHTTSITEALAGNPADLALQISATPQGGLGYYSPYISVVRDLIRIFGAFRSAEYQYIPALAVVRDDRLDLLLNTAPSFRKPQSVFVAALPAIEPPRVPPLRAVRAAPRCVRPGLVLPVEGAPLVYSTRLAHNMALRLRARSGEVIDLPATADPEQGGFVVDTRGLPANAVAAGTTGTLRGSWGFAAFDGPQFDLQVAQPGGWSVAGAESPSLVVGRDQTVALRGAAPECVERVTLRHASGATRDLAWTARADGIDVTVPLGDAEPGAISLVVAQSGIPATAPVDLIAYAAVARIDGVTLHAGDAAATLAGQRLDLVATVRVGDTEFTPGPLERVGDGDRLPLTAPAPPALAAGDAFTARVTLGDGRVVSRRGRVARARPVVTLIAKTVDPATTVAGARWTLADDVVPHDARLTFSVRAGAGTRFTGGEAIEVATADGVASARVTATTGLTLRDPTVAVAVLEPAKALGAAAFGPLRFRLVQGDAAGDWQPLATLVRLPEVRRLACDAGPAGPCDLSGDRLFLIDSVAADPAFARKADVPEGFTGSRLPVPRPDARALYVKLHDAPGARAVLTLPGSR